MMQCGLINLLKLVWTLTKEKLEAAHMLVQEQMAAGHLEVSNYPLEYTNFCLLEKVW